MKRNAFLNDVQHSYLKIHTIIGIILYQCTIMGVVLNLNAFFLLLTLFYLNISLVILRRMLKENVANIHVCSTYLKMFFKILEYFKWTQCAEWKKNSLCNHSVVFIEQQTIFKFNFYSNAFAFLRDQTSQIFDEHWNPYGSASLNKLVSTLIVCMNYILIAKHIKVISYV